MVRIGEAECNRDSLIQTALAEEKRMASKFVNDTEIELYKRNFEIKKAGYDMEVETARAQSELAFQLQVHLNIKYLLQYSVIYCLQHNRITHRQLKFTKKSKRRK